MEKENLTHSKSNSNSDVGRNNAGQGTAASKSILVEAPTITLPKGGGGIKGIDEKFTVNASNGTASVSIPLPFSPSRNSFAPSLNLSYNSGGGNGIFGLGWNLNIPSITRKTEKELPRYLDHDESDTFIYSSEEDLVPVLNNLSERLIRKVENSTHYPYRPRIEGSFARIERIIEKTGNCYWKVTTKENVTLIFGRSSNARIADPHDPSRIFKWLLEFSHDDKGNCYAFEYKQEDITGVRNGLPESHRLKEDTIANCYLKRVGYCNKDHFDKDQLIGDWDVFVKQIDFLLELVFDYGEHNTKNPQHTDNNDWVCRDDPFSDYRSGFEIRTYRLCQRVLMFHRFKELGDSPCLVRSTDFEYSKTPAFTFLSSAVQSGYRRKSFNSYTTKSFPPVEFTYEPLGWNTELKSVSIESLENAPAGIDDRNYQWIDLYGEGVSGILSEQADALFYKSNRGNGDFAPAQVVSPKPSFSGLAGGGVQLMELEGNGKKFLVSRAAQGFFELTEENEWIPFKNFISIPNINWADPNLKMLDLNGDGLADILISEENVFTYYQSKGKIGYDDYSRVAKPFDENQGPSIVFADVTQSIVLADMSGDGLSDIVRIRNGEIVYWPNLGYGRFGQKVSMGNAPIFDTPEAFDTRYIKLADLDGSGTTDIVYVGQNTFQIYFNQSGNSWNIINLVKGLNPIPFPTLEETATVSVIDLLGNGTGCITWSSPLPGNVTSPLRYVDLMGGKKPHVMTSYKNNLGKEINISYKPSTYYYLEDKKNGVPWITKLPFPVQCVSSVETVDLVSKTRFANSYRYRHGYYDYAEREFRGFGYVEQRDTNFFNGDSLDQPPVVTKTWFHTGAFLDKQKILSQFEREYFYNQPDINYKEPQLEDVLIDDDLSIEEWSEALRACKGTPIRIEVLADDNSPIIHLPYTSAQHSCVIHRIQSRGGNKHSVFMVHERENITFTYERNVADSRIAHTLNTVFDQYGNILETASVVYGRNKQIKDADLKAEDLVEQQRPHITYTVNDYIQTDIITDMDYRMRVPYAVSVWELTGFAQPLTGKLYTVSELKDMADQSVGIGYESDPDFTKMQKRLIERDRHYFRDNATDKRLPLGEFQSLMLPFESYKLAFTKSHALKVSDNKITDVLLLSGGYVKLADDGNAVDNPDNFWISSGRQHFDAEHFFQVTKITDPFQKSTHIKYDPDYKFYIASTEDPVKNINEVTEFDFVTLGPKEIRDLNKNISTVAFDTLGILVGMAVKGKGDEADDLAAFDIDLSDDDAGLFFADPLTKGPELLAHATSRFVYDFSQNHFRIATITREEHHKINKNAAIQLSFEYFDGMGQSLQKKVRAKKGNAWSAVNGGKELVKDVNPRWIGTGSVIRNNKNNPVKKYEEFFSTTHLLEKDDILTKIGVTPIIYYDPLSRVVKTIFPDDTFSRVEFDAWKQTTFDQNDTVKSSGWYRDRVTTPTDIATAEEVDAATKAAMHNDTPGTVHLDSLGRQFLTVTVSKQGQRDKFKTRVIYDIEGNQRQVIDAMENVVMRYDYNMLGGQVKQLSMDAGTRIMLSNVAGKPWMQWDNKGRLFSYSYDDAQRPLETRLTINGIDKVFDRLVYGEETDKDVENNLRGKPYKHFDTAGLVINATYDFKNNLTSSNRKILKKHEVDVNWNVLTEADLSDENFQTENSYDALNRTTRSTIHQNNIIRHEFNVAGLLESVFASVAGAAEKTYVRSIDHNEKGKRSRIVYGNDTITHYVYDERTFRLKQLTTTDKNGTTLFQDLYYTYDPVGNITQITDKAQQILYFGGTRVDPVSDYTYDALYQLIQANGREHIGQNSMAENKDNKNYRNFPFAPVNTPAPGDTVAMRLYTQKYTYDAASNIKLFAHEVRNGQGGFVREYCYNNNDADRATCNVANDVIKNNRLLRTTIGADKVDYEHDVHGNILTMPHLPVMEWNFKDQLVKTSQTVMNAGIPSATHYIYDGAGIRVRKVITVQNSGAKSEERIYLGGFEVYIKYKGDEAETVDYIRESQHIMDDKSRVALVESKIDDAGSGEESTLGKNYIRYQYSNHLGSAMLELDENGTKVSYEEYHPYGTTSFHAMDKQINPVAKRYRYTGLERDEENGFGYHNARYYVSWLGRWLNCDPIGIKDGMNVFEYSKNSPLNIQDLTGLTGKKTVEVMDVIESETRDAAFQGGRDAQAEARKKGMNPLSLSKKTKSKLSSRQGQLTMERMVENLERNAISNRYPGVSRRLVPELHVDSEIFISAGQHPKPGGRNPDLGLFKKEIRGVDPMSEWNERSGRSTNEVFEKKSYDVKVGSGHVKDKKDFQKHAGMTVEEVRPFSRGLKLAMNVASMTTSLLSSGLAFLAASHATSNLERGVNAAGAAGMTTALTIEGAGRLSLAVGGDASAALKAISIGSKVGAALGMGLAIFNDLLHYKDLGKKPEAGHSNIYFLGPVPMILQSTPAWM